MYRGRSLSYKYTTVCYNTFFLIQLRLNLVIIQTSEQLFFQNIWYFAFGLDSPRNRVDFRLDSQKISRALIKSKKNIFDVI